MAEQPNFPGEIRHVVFGAIDEASRRGSASVEAEDLLLVIAAGSGPATDVLIAAGLGHSGILALLQEERRRSLDALGVAIPDEQRLCATIRARRPTWGTSLRSALARARRRGARAATPADVAIGVLLAEYGTVPRALAFGGIETAAVISRLREVQE